MARGNPPARDPKFLAEAYRGIDEQFREEEEQLRDELTAAHERGDVAEEIRIGVALDSLERKKQRLKSQVP